jgi:hypothetical protein
MIHTVWIELPEPPVLVLESAALVASELAADSLPDSLTLLAIVSSTELVAPVDIVVVALPTVALVPVSVLALPVAPVSSLLSPQPAIARPITRARAHLSKLGRVMPRTIARPRVVEDGKGCAAQRSPNSNE